MRDNILFSDAQSRTNPTSTGTISTDVFDQEQNSAGTTLITDDQVECWCNVIITSAALTSGGTEGIIFEVRSDDNSNLATAEIVIAAFHALLADVVTGAKFSFKVKRDVMKRYIGGWLRAKSTTYTGTIIVDMFLSDTPISENESLQKVPA